MLSRCGPLSTEQPHCCLKRYSCDCAAATVSRVITMGQESLGSSAGIVTIQTTQPILTSPHRPTWDLGSGPETLDLGPPVSGPGVWVTDLRMPDINTEWPVCTQRKWAMHLPCHLCPAATIRGASAPHLTLHHCWPGIHGLIFWWMFGGKWYFLQIVPGTASREHDMQNKDWKQFPPSRLPSQNRNSEYC